MRFLRIRITRFGPLADVDTGEADLPAMVAVLGPNEAGKSAFFAAVRGLLYGIYPASRDGNPWAPWDGRELEMEAELETREGERMEVRRRLLTTPWGRLRRGRGEEEDLRNRALPCAVHVPAEAYEHVFAITLPDLANLQKGAGWERVRDRLVVGMGAQDLGSPRVVAEALAADAGALWQPHRRGKPRDRTLSNELDALAGRLREARDRDRALREHDRALGEATSELERLRSERARAREALERGRTLQPAGERLRALAALREDAGDLALLEGLPPDPPARLAGLEAEVEGREAERDAARASLEEADQRVPPPDPVTEGLLGLREETRRLAAEAPISAERAVRLGTLRDELGRLERSLDLRAGELFEVPWGEVDSDELDRVPAEELRARIRHRDEAAARRSGAEESLRTEEARPGREEAGGGPARARSLALGGGMLVLIGVLVTLVGGGAGGEFTPLALLGILTGGVGLLLVAAGWIRLAGAGEGERRDLRERELARLRARVDELKEEEARAAEEVGSLLERLPLRPERSARPGEGLATELERLREDLHRAEGSRASLETLESNEDALAERLRALREEVPGLELPPEPPTALPLLDHLLADADAWRTKRERALEERDRRREAVQEADRALAEARADLAAFSARVAETAPGVSATEGARALARRLDARAEAERLAADLRREHGELQRLRERVREAESDPLLERKSIAELAEDERTLGERIEKLGAEVERLTSDIRHLSDRETVAEVEGEIARVREERERVQRERDRLWVLSRAVQVAERRFRDAHQPELVRTAGHHLHRITGGRYRSLVLGDDESPDRLLVAGDHLPGMHPVEEPLSTGTREQVYLALRLAVLDVLEGEGEPLPLILDEALVNWDRDRRARGLDLMREVTTRRQVFLFTCHPDLAREAEARGARLLTLADPPGAGRP